MADPAPRRVIKRYANRKLYDTRDSRYVTLLQIAEYVRQGQEVSIIDNTTKEDLTNVTLAQIVYEEERKSDAKQKSNSVTTLRAFIQDGSERLLTSFREGPVGKLIARPEEILPKTKFLSPKELIDELQRLADDRIRGILSHAIQQVHTLNTDVQKLHDRISTLEQKLVEAQAARRSDDKQS